MKRITRALTLITLFAVALVTIAGCAASESQSVQKSVEVEREMVASDSAAGYAGEANWDTAESPMDPDEYLDEERMIISNGYLSLTVDDTESAIAQITSITEGLGGYVANSNAYHSGELLRGSMMVRVPAAHSSPRR